jgi:hypothetical protein
VLCEVPTSTLDANHPFTLDLSCPINNADRDGVIAGLENVGEGVAESNRELREQLRDLRLEVARLGSVAAELQSNPVDLPVRSLRSLREVN